MRDPGSEPSLAALLDAALARDGEAREILLDALAREDPDAVRRVRRALAAAESARGFLDTSPLRTSDGPPPDPVLPASHEPPTIPAFRLLRRLGMGGMGEVWLGERIAGGFVQQVAVKWMRTDVRASAARFDAERSILAALEHPSIARLYDGGVAADGRPYMVMEYVDGQPLLAWCSAQGAGLAQRLDLFLQVCDAVAHAHTQLVVHRDIKPANILVTEDARAKLLDFGIAKLLDASEPAFATQTAALSPHYAAPEQFTGQPVGMAADVHALGVTLYELLTARLPWPIDASPLGAAFARERTAPAAPSRQPAGPGGVAPAALQGDLDAIVMKAIRPEPSARYPDARALADDLRRHLAHRPVLARKQAAGYVARRFLRRHWLPVAAAGALVAVGVVGVAATAAQSRRAADAAARASVINAFLVGVFEGNDPERNRGVMPSARDLLDRGREQLAAGTDPPDLRAALQGVLGDLYMRLGDYATAEPLLRAAAAAAVGSEDERRSRALALAEVLRAQGRAGEARDVLGAVPERASAPLDEQLLRERVRFEADSDLAAIDRLAALESTQSDPVQRERVTVLRAQLLAEAHRDREALPLLEAAHAAARERHGPDALAVARIADLLVNALSDTQQFARSVALAEDVVRIRTVQLGPDHPLTLRSRNALANALMEAGDQARAVVEYREAIERAQRQAAPDQAQLFEAWTNLAFLHYERRDLAAALAAYGPAIEIGSRLYGADDPRVLTVRGSGAFVRFRSGDAVAGGAEMEAVLAAWRARPDRARFMGYADVLRTVATSVRSGPGGVGADEALLVEAIEVAAALQGPAHAIPNQTRVLLGLSRQRRGDLAGALDAFEASLAQFRRAFPEGHPDLARTLTFAAAAALEAGDAEKARAYAHDAVAYVDVHFADAPARRYESHARLAQALAALGRTDEARAIAAPLRAEDGRAAGLPDTVLAAMARLVASP